MDRILDLTAKPYATPEGYAAAAVTPLVGWETPETPLLTEPVGKERPLASVLSFNQRYLAMMGVQPGEIFNYGVITTKPYGTYMTFFNPEASGRFAWRFASDLPAEKFAGPLTLIDLSGQIGPRDEIQVSHLQPFENRIGKDAVVFLRTDYSRKHRPADPAQSYYDDSPVMSREAAEWLVGKGIKTIGADVRTLDPTYAGRSVDYDIRQIFNRAGILVVEDLANLDQVTSRHNYAITGLPLGIHGVTGGPARVFIIDRNSPTDFVDATHPLEYYPEKITDELPFVPPTSERPLNQLGDYPNPIPGRINPRETQVMVARGTRLIPFNVQDARQGTIGQEMYIQYGHSTGTHVEGAFFDPWGRHMIPDEILRRYVRMPADRLVGPGVLIDLSDWIGPGMLIEEEHIRDADPGVRESDIVFVKTEISDMYFYGQSNIQLTPGFSAEAAKYLLERKIRALVLDAPSVERSEPFSSGPQRFTSNKIHYMFHRNDIPIVDWGVKFRNFRKDRFIAAIMALPLSHQGGFLTQLLAIEEWE
ncbi:MAG: cyclase family protein [Ardenticatenaceae bacterium]|nr:cyclase family protein [Ardenticatenaceae bacterium]